MDEQKKIEIIGRKVTVTQYGVSGSVAIPEELMSEHGITVGSQARWFTVVEPSGEKILVLRPDKD